MVGEGLGAEKELFRIIYGATLEFPRFLRWYLFGYKCRL
jgi:hypothetical protein